MDRNGVVLENPKDLKLVHGPICIGGHWYSVKKDLNANWSDFRYGVYLLEPRLEGGDEHSLKTVSLTLFGAKLYLSKLAKFR